MTSVLKRKILVNKDRGAFLTQLYEDVKIEFAQQPAEEVPTEDVLGMADTQPALIRVLLIGFEQDDPRVEQLRGNLGDGYVVKAVTLIQRDWVRMMKTATPTYTIDKESAAEDASCTEEDSRESAAPPANEVLPTAPPANEVLPTAPPANEVLPAGPPASEHAPDATTDASKKKKEKKKERKKRQAQVRVAFTAAPLPHGAWAHGCCAHEGVDQR
jgi:hypothetical protein